MIALLEMFLDLPKLVHHLLELVDPVVVKQDSVDGCPAVLVPLLFHQLNRLATANAADQLLQHLSYFEVQGDVVGNVPKFVLLRVINACFLDQKDNASHVTGFDCEVKSCVFVLIDCILVSTGG